MDTCSCRGEDGREFGVQTSIKILWFGLRQASCAWNIEFNQFLIQYDLKPSTTDPFVHV